MAAQITPFNMTRDINGFNGFGLPFSNKAYSALLLADDEITLTVPETGNANYPNLFALFTFQAGSFVWVALNASATRPLGAFSQTNSEQNPQGRYVKSGDVLHFITANDQVEMGVIFYATK